MVYKVYNKNSKDRNKEEENYRVFTFTEEAEDLF